MPLQPLKAERSGAALASSADAEEHSGHETNDTLVNTTAQSSHRVSVLPVSKNMQVAALQNVCRSWKSALSLVDSQIPCITYALCAELINTAHQPCSEHQNGIISNTPTNWDLHGRPGLADHLLYRSGCVPDRRQVSDLPLNCVGPQVDHVLDLCLAQFSSSPGSQKTAAAQQVPVSWLNRVLPAKLLPYAHLMRLDKPIGMNTSCC